MDRYRTTGLSDDLPIQVGDDAFVGVNSYDSPENLQPGQVQEAVNMDFTSQDAETRGGFVCLPALASPDFSDGWTLQNASATTTLRSLAFGNGLFIALPSGNTFMSSTDGETWTTGSCQTGSWRYLTFGGSYFVAVGDDGVVQYTQDGINWSSGTIDVTKHFYTVCYGFSAFFAFATDGTVFRATTPGSWASYSDLPGDSTFWATSVFANGRMVVLAAVGTGDRGAYSDDGSTWTLCSGVTDSDWTSVAYGNGAFLAKATALSGGGIMSSTDGITWSTLTVSGISFTSMNAAGFGGGLFVTVGNHSSFISPDLVSWYEPAGDTPTGGWNRVAFGNNRFVAFKDTGALDRVMVAVVRVGYAVALYSDPDDAGSQWIMLAQPTRVAFNSFGRQQRVVEYATGETVSQPATIVQANNQVFIFRGPDETPLYWDGNWNNNFELVPATTAGAGFASIPNSNHAVYYQNRLWAIDGKDSVAASEVLDFTAWDELAEEFNLNTGSSDYLVCTYPFGTKTLVVFKNKSILALNDVDGSLSDVSATEITRQVGAIGINAVVSVGPDLVYVGDRNINLLSLTSTNNALQHKTLPLSRNIKRIMDRVNWTVASKVSMGYYDNRLYIALPLDNATHCSTVLVYNFHSEQWYGEWSFPASLNMGIIGWVVGTYFGVQRMHAVTEDGRIFVTDEGPMDICGATFEEIEASLTTRAYRANNENRANRRMALDVGTWRPSFSVTAYVDGANEYETILSAQTFSRSDSWIFNDSSYDLTNANNDYNRAGRKDYAGLCSESIQSGADGFLPEMLQDYRLPLITRRKGRLAWFKVENTQGRIVIRGVSSESRTGDRSNLVQVL